MENKKQTAVEWLFDNLNLCFDKFDNGEYSYTEFVNASNEIKDQAKAMEKQQMIEDMSKMQIIDDVDFDGNVTFIFNNIEEYYKETYEH